MSPLTPILPTAWILAAALRVAAHDGVSLIQAHLDTRKQDPVQVEIQRQEAEWRSPLDAQPTVMPRATVGNFNGVPVYGYDRVKSAGNGDEWMAMFPKHFSNNRLQEFCRDNVTAPARCTYIGHPNEGGLHYAVISGYEPVVSKCVHKSGGPRFIEVDGPTYLLDIPVASSMEEASTGRVKVPWGLDRIDNGIEGLDGSYSQGEGGKGVHIYHFDTGVQMLDDFEGRVVPTLDAGISATFSSPAGCRAPEARNRNHPCAHDLQGHGTHTAGTIGSRTYGVAKQATIHAVKVLNDKGYGSWSMFITAFDWVMAHGRRPAIISASLGGTGKMMIVKEAIDGAVAHDITVVVAAGNSNVDTCSFTPAFVRSAITVGATDMIDQKAPYSNWGACMDVFAPGTDIVSLDIHEGSGTLSGTSMSAPHAAGVAALVLGANPSLTPAEVQARIVAGSTRQAVTGLDKPGTANRLLFVGPRVTQVVTTQSLYVGEEKPPYTADELPPPDEPETAPDEPEAAASANELLPPDELKPPYSARDLPPAEAWEGPTAAAEAWEGPAAEAFAGGWA